MSTYQLLLQYKVPIIGVLLSAIVGCGSSDSVKTYPTTGKVIYKGTALGDADIVFSSNGAEGQPSSILGLAKTDSEGKFSIRTQLGPTKSLVGAVEGKHVVTIAKYIPPNNMSEEEHQRKMAAEVAAMEAKGYLDPDEVTPPKIPFLPLKYQHPGHSQLTATVEANGKNEFVFELD
jgi:hypothetical protein